MDSPATWKQYVESLCADMSASETVQEAQLSRRDQMAVDIISAIGRRTEEIGARVNDLGRDLKKLKRLEKVGPFTLGDAIEEFEKAVKQGKALSRTMSKAAVKMGYEVHDLYY